MSNLDIINSESIEFEFTEEDFNIIFEEDKWFAKHNDEETFEDLIILEDKKSSIFFKEDTELFNGFILTVEHFLKFKDIINEL